MTSERTAEINAKADRITAKAEAHFEKHRQQWTNRQYGRLLARDGERMEFRPSGMAQDRKAHLMRAADQLVCRKQSMRLALIEQAASNLRAGRCENRNQSTIGRLM
ncbi:hypothetical protein NS277_07325 [Novosphingobium barchaimii]|nr:hypothetical protein NS277_07325 [Novosphingobium barchaimii]